MRSDIFIEWLKHFNYDVDEESLLNRLPESDDVIEYFRILDHEIPTLLMKKLLIWYKLINQEVDDDEIPAISVKKQLVDRKLLLIFEQQNDIEFNNGDLRIFRKYLV